MITIDIGQGGTIELERSRTVFCKLPNAPSKGAAQNLEKMLRQYLEDYRKESPGTDWPLTPYQQWAIALVHNACKTAHPRVRLQKVKQYIIENRQQLRKSHYETHRLHPITANHGAA